MREPVTCHVTWCHVTARVAREVDREEVRNDSPHRGNGVAAGGAGARRGQDHRAARVRCRRAAWPAPADRDGHLPRYRNRGACGRARRQRTRRADTAARALGPPHELPGLVHASPGDVRRSAHGLLHEPRAARLRAHRDLPVARRQRRHDEGAHPVARAHAWPTGARSCSRCGSATTCSGWASTSPSTA